MSHVDLLQRIKTLECELVGLYQEKQRFDISEVKRERARLRARAVPIDRLARGPMPGSRRTARRALLEALLEKAITPTV